MSFKSKAQARAAFGGYIKGFSKNKAKEFADKTDFSKIPDHVKEELELGKAKVSPEQTDGLPSPKPETLTGNKPVQNPEVTQAKEMEEELDLGTTKKDPEQTDGLKSPTPENTTGIKAPGKDVTQAVKGKTSTQKVAPSLTDAQKTKGENKGNLSEELNVGETKVKPEQFDGLKSPTPESKTGLTPVKNPEVTQAKKAVNEELNVGIATKTPEQTDGLKSPKPENKTGNTPVKAKEVTQAAKVLSELDKGEAQSEPEQTDGDPTFKTTDGMPTSMGHPQVTQAETMDEQSQAKHKSLEEKAKTLKAEMEALEKEMEEVKTLGVKKHIHNTKKEEVNKLGEEIKELKEKRKETPIKAPHEREGNKHMPPATKHMVSKKWKAKNDKKGWKKDIKKQDESNAKQFNESFSNVFIRKTSQKNMIAERVLNTYWEQAIQLQEQNGDIKNKGNKNFWYGVVKNFNSILNEQELAKAKSIMTEREKFNLNAEKFVHCLSKDDYINASSFMAEMVSSSLANLIDTQKIQYQKELGEKVSKKIREV
jgi:hypothetical protein